MHSSSVLSSILMAAAIAYAAPVAPSSASSSSNTIASTATSASASASASSPSRTADSNISASSSLSSSSTRAPTTASSTASSSTASPSFEGKTGTTGNNNAAYDASFPAIVKVNSRAGDAGLIAKLLSVSTQGDRQRLLNQPGDFVFDFNDADAPEGSESVGKGGFSVAATAKSFPALIGLGSSQTVAQLGPCGFNSPHVHNRATELNTVVEGSLVTNFVGENGVAAVQNTVTKYQMAVFPQGAVHAEFNPSCEPAVFVASFNHEDPGVTTMAQSFFGLRPDGVAAALGGVDNIAGADLESFRDLLPTGIIQGVDACLKKCGIQRNAKRDLSEFATSA